MSSGDRPDGQQPGGGDDIDAELQRRLAALTPQQRAQLRREALKRVLRTTPVQVENKKGEKKIVSLQKFMQRVQRMRARYESGAMDETVRTVPRWVAQDMTPGRTLRPGAYKQQLRQREEAQLALDRFGQGVVTSPQPLLGHALGGRRDFVWGIYGRADGAERVLGEAWAGKEQKAAAADPELYTQALQRAHQMELTLIALTSRPLPLAATREALAQRLEASMRRLGGGGEGGGSELALQHKADLRDFVAMFDDKRVAGAGWMDGRGRVKEGTHFLFSTTPKGGLLAEAITPGRLKDRRTSRICINRSPLLTASVFDVFLGEQPLDPEGKEDVGHGLLWAANGWRFRPWEMRPGQYIAEQRPDGSLGFPKPPAERLEQMALPLRPSVFQVVEERTRPLRMLVGRLYGSGGAALEAAR